MKWFTSPALLFVLMPIMMVILAVGTIAQKWMGLHAALETYFFSWVIWLWALPLPGGLLVMSTITLNLSCKFLLNSKWTAPKSGTNIIHLGVLILMIGGLGALIFKKETVIVLPLNTPISSIQDYIQTDLVILKNDKPFYNRDFKTVRLGQIEKLPFTLTITDTCHSCQIVLRPEDEKDGWIGAFQSMMLIDAPRPINPEETLQGIDFTIKGSKKQDGKYLTFEGFPKPLTITSGDNRYTILIERHRTTLPFSLTLTQFDKEYYTGTRRAKNYTSHISINDSNTEFKTIITMNDPFRYGGYSFYQSSFIGDETSVLAVVENRAYVFPYIASLMITIGLLLHLVILRRRK